MTVRCRFDFKDATGRTAPVLLVDPSRLLVAASIAEVPATVAAADEAWRAGSFVAGFLSYDAAPAFDRAFQAPGAATGAGPLPLAWFGVFGTGGVAGECETSRDVRRYDDFPTALELSAELSPAEYEGRVAAVREGIASGAHYQVNLTQRLRGRTGHGVEALYDALLRDGTGGYLACITTPDWSILSASPELFFRIDGRRITTRPMKGTAPRGRWSAEDDAIAAQLAASPKERAENVMIVDLLRNDLGRVAETGSVRVTDLFSVETYPTVHQLTSTVDATLREDASLLDVFRALFPCGSVTGAPKVAAMQEIARLETSARGLYCGAVGLMRPGGECTFNVAIRTLVADRRTGDVTCGVGGAVTWDSDPAAEHAEMILKARAFTRPPRPDFALVETMRMVDGVVERDHRHLARIAASARYFGIPDPWKALRAALAGCAAAHPHGAWRVRAVVERDGNVHVTTDVAPDAIGSFPLALARKPVDSSDPFLYHKTTHRAVYDRARAAHPESWDVLLHNAEGQLTEFTRGNLALELDGVVATPPLRCGLLPGILRGELVEAGTLAERVLTVEDLTRAQRIWFLNALRGWIEVTRQG